MWRGEAREEAPSYRTKTEVPHRPAAEPVVVLVVARLHGTELVLPAPEGLPPDATVLVSVVGPVTDEHVDIVRAHKARLDEWARTLADIADDPVTLSDEDRDIYR